MLLPIQVWLFLPNMVTEVMHLKLSMFIWMGESHAGTSGGFNIKEVSLWWRLLTIANCWDQIDIEFSLTRDTILEWKLQRKTTPVA